MFNSRSTSSEVSIPIGARDARVCHVWSTSTATDTGYARVGRSTRLVFWHNVGWKRIFAGRHGGYNEKVNSNR